MSEGEVRRRRREPTLPMLIGPTVPALIPAELRRYTRDLVKWRSGNRVVPLRGGRECFPAMLRAIASARTSIGLETYIIDGDATGRRFADALVERAKAGVTVRLLYDALGGFGLPGAVVEELRDAGAEVAVFHRFAPWRQRWSFVRRDHRKILVVDDEIAFTGGINISDDYADAGDGGKGWHDVHCEIHGPVVLDLSRLFRRTWLYAGGSDYPAPVAAERSAEVAGPTFARVLDNAYRRRRRRFRRAYLAAINAARETVLIENAYFVPDRGVRAVLRRAAARGVDVRVIIPSRSDVLLLELASLFVCRRLANAGVKILRWRGPMMHAKTAVVDARWATIGSYNLDNVSLRFNLEVGVETLDRDLGELMRAHFEIDAAATDPYDENAWRRLPWYRKVAAWFAYRLRRWL
jgi:cardiolipin synthase